MSSFSTGLSGLLANNLALDVVGNNLANLNTNGYKSSAVQFKDVIGQTAGSVEVGAGVSANSTNRKFTQGSVQNTGGSLDAAIQGAGFFVTKDQNGNTLYTRDGGFKIDVNGNLSTSTGELVQGWTSVNGVLNATGATSNISVNALASQSPTPTTTMTISANLNASAAVGDTFSTPIEVVDSLGATHVVTVTYTKTGANAWDFEAFIPGEDVTGGTAGTPTSIGTGTLTFDGTGALTAPAAPGTTALATTGGLANGADDLAIDFNLYNAASTPLITQFAQASAASSTTQNGIQTAQITDIRMGDGGKLVASYSNGKQLSIAQIALASVGNPDSMIAIGNNNFIAGAETQTPTIGTADTGSRGKVLGGAIEASNVDLASEFTKLIIYQRGYQANSKVITTLDQINQVLLSIKQ